MQKVFIDVGGFAGESSCAALDPAFGFQRVFCFEPVRACASLISSTYRSEALEVINAGLLDRTCELPIYFPGTLGASIFADAPVMRGATAASELSAFLSASEFFRERIGESERVWMKLNCEGSEVAILKDLIRSGEAPKLQEVLIDFDAGKIPSARAGMDELLDVLGTVAFSFHFPEEVQYGMVNNYGGIHNWLRLTCPIESSARRRMASLLYQVRRALDGRLNGYYKIRLRRGLGLRPQAPLRASSLRARIGNSSRTREASRVSVVS